MNLGTTFDYEQAKNLGLNWKNSLKQIIKLKLSPVRIGIKWSRVEYEKNKYKWTTYDYIINELNTHKIPIILIVGMKAPRWPEFYIPDYLEFDKKRNYTISKSDKFLKERLFGFLKIAIQRYKNVDNIHYIQVENEPLIRFGPNNWKLSYKFLKEEIEYVRKFTKKSILLTTSGLPTTGIIPEILSGGLKAKLNILKLADCIGLNVFPRFEIKVLKKISFANASWLSWKYLRYWFGKCTKLGKECMVTELQAERWESGKWNFKDPHGNKTCNPDMIKEYLHKLEVIGFKKILEWGTEFHLKCLKEGNESWIKNVYKL